jgi:hypothetical protein
MTSAPAPETFPAPNGAAAPAGAEAPVDSPTMEACRAHHRQLQFEVSRYIELLLGELSTMARAAELRHLLHFIELTRQEAGDQTRRCRIDR